MLAAGGYPQRPRGVRGNFHDPLRQTSGIKQFARIRVAANDLLVRIVPVLLVKAEKRLLEPRAAGEIIGLVFGSGHRARSLTQSPGEMEWRNWAKIGENWQAKIGGENWCERPLMDGSARTKCRRI